MHIENNPHYLLWEGVAITANGAALAISLLAVCYISKVSTFLGMGTVSYAIIPAFTLLCSIPFAVSCYRCTLRNAQVKEDEPLSEATYSVSKPISPIKEIPDSVIEPSIPLSEISTKLVTPPEHISLIRSDSATEPSIPLCEVTRSHSLPISPIRVESPEISRLSARTSPSTDHVVRVLCFEERESAEKTPNFAFLVKPALLLTLPQKPQSPFMRRLKEEGVTHFSRERVPPHIKESRRTLSPQPLPQLVLEQEKPPQTVPVKGGPPPPPPPPPAIGGKGLPPPLSHLQKQMRIIVELPRFLGEPELPKFMQGHDVGIPESIPEATRSQYARAIDEYLNGTQYEVAVKKGVEIKREENGLSHILKALCKELEQQAEDEAKLMALNKKIDENLKEIRIMTQRIEQMQMANSRGETYSLHVKVKKSTQSIPYFSDKEYQEHKLHLSTQKPESMRTFVKKNGVIPESMKITRQIAKFHDQIIRTGEETKILREEVGALTTRIDNRAVLENNGHPFSKWGELVNKKRQSIGNWESVLKKLEGPALKKKGEKQKEISVELDPHAVKFSSFMAMASQGLQAAIIKDKEIDFVDENAPSSVTEEG